MIKKLILSGLLLAVVIPVFGQEEVPMTETSPDNKLKFAVALNGSPLGVGGEFAMAFSDKLAVRLRGHYLNLEDVISQREEEIGSETYLLDAGPKSTVADITVEYLPFRGSSFKLVGGLGYFVEGNLTVRGYNRDGISYKEMTIDPEDIGSVVFKMDYSGVAPYLGFGFGRAVPKNRVGIGFEIGTFYMGEPEASIVGTDLIAENAEINLQKFQDDISDYRWYPFINLRIAVNLTK